MKAFKISNDVIEELRQYMPNIDELVKGDIGDFFIELDNTIVYYFIHDEPTPTSDRLQQIYDEVYFDNLD